MWGDGEMKKVTELTNTELNHYVALANGWTETMGGLRGDEPAWLLSDGKSRLVKSMYTPSTDWCQGGNIIESRGIEIMEYIDHDGIEVWSASIMRKYSAFFGNGDTHLIAAMRCYVTSVFGETVDD